MLSQLINTAKQDTVHIDSIRLDGGTQPRQGIDDVYVTELAESMVDGAKLPPVDVMYDGANYWLFDGYHRVAAHRKAGFLVVDATIHQGTQADAQWRSYAANQTHGLRRTNDDKQRAIKAALRHPNGATLADREIARHLGVDHKTVGTWREKMEATGEIPQSTTRTGADGRSIDTTNIGTNPAPKPVNKYVPPIFVNELQAIVLRWAKENWAGEWPENPSHTNGTFWRDITAWLHANDSRPWSEGDLKAAIKEVHGRVRTLAAKEAAEHSDMPAITTRQAADILRPTIDQFYAHDGSRRYQVPDMQAAAQLNSGGVWRACERALANYTYTSALLMAAIRLIADEITQAQRSASAISNSDPVVAANAAAAPLPTWADEAVPAKPSYDRRRLTAEEACTALLGQAIVHAYPVSGVLRITLDNNQLIMISSPSGRLLYDIEEA